jgi:histidinol dehydrogenase
MIQIYDDWQQAQRTVLRRKRADWDKVPESIRQGIREVFRQELSPHQAVARILADVRECGDEALREWSWRIDGWDAGTWEVPPGAWAAARARLPSELLQAIEHAAERIRAFHERQPIASWSTSDLGGRLGQRIAPLARVGVYVPGGSAPLPSSLLMAAIPAQVAGVAEIIVCTPPSRGGKRHLPDAILAAADVVGVQRLFALGGAQAIAAMAYGTETVSRVDKIAGAGGLFVTLAKRQVFGEVGLDGIHGPTETVIVADEHANPAWVAADLLAQAEHDVLATAILLTPSRALAEDVQAQIERQVPRLSHTQTLEVSLGRQGGIVVTPDLETAVRLADEFAPEHLCLSVHEPERWVDQVHNAGGLFLGEHSFEVLGDYAAGPSHIMPTGGTARFASPLSVLDFVKITSIIALDPDTAGQLCNCAGRFADAESLSAHAAAARSRGGRDE